MPRWVGGESRAELLSAAAVRMEKLTGRQEKTVRIEYVMKRTESRDAGRLEFSAPALYLDDAAFAVHEAKPESINWFPRFSRLKELSPEDPQKLSEEDRAEIWQVAFEILESLQAEHRDKRVQRQIARALADFLIEHFPPISRSTDSIRSKFRDDMAPWIASGRSRKYFSDRRRLKSGNHRRKDFSQDDRKIALYALAMKSVSSGHGHLRDKGQLSDGYCENHRYDRRVDGSNVSKSTRKRITPLVKAALSEFGGERQSRLDSPHITRVWDGVEPLDWFVADDVSWNHYFKQRGADGKWTLTRGECLVMADLLTDYPLDFLLIGVPDFCNKASYNGVHIRQLALKVHDRFGLPRKGFYFERGTWESRFVAGEKTKGWEPRHWREFELGLNDSRLGIGVENATTARAKPIEGWFNQMQRRMQLIYGYVGRDERHDRHEEIQQLKERAKRGDTSALQHFRTLEELRGEYRKVIEEFMVKPGNGDRLNGRTPAEAVAEAMNQKPLVELNSIERSVLATHQKIARLNPRKGVMLKIPGYKRPICYANAETGKLVERGETHVRCLINFDRADIIICEDIKGTHRFEVPGQIAPAMDASPELLKKLGADRRAHLAPAKALFGELRHAQRATMVRDGTMDDHTQESRKFFVETTASRQSEASQESREITSLRRRAEALGCTIHADLSNAKRRSALDLQLRGLELQRQQTSSK